MEAARVEGYGNVEVTTDSYTLSAPATPPALAEQFDSPKFDPALTSSAKRRKVKGTNQDSQEKDTPPSVSNCYVFKSRLQEYCQKAGLTTPVYETIKEGPSHEPSFKSTVIVNNVRYDSLPGFFNRKAAEQSAAEVALVELANSTDVKFRISQPVHETGLCKNLLQEYAQKMNYAMPLYECSKEEKEGRTPMYSCVVEIGGIKYIGASASTKKEAEIKAARTALLAIQTATPVSEDQTGNSIYTVIPLKKRVSDLKISSQETKAALKPKKGRFKKQQRKKKQGVRMDNSAGGTSHLEVNADGHDGVGLGVKDAVSSGPYMVIGGLEVYMDHQGVVEVDATDASSSQDKTNGGSDIHTEGQRQEMSITNVVSSQGMDSGPPETTTNACETNAVSSQGVDSGPSETTTNACVTNAVSAQGMDSGPSETTTNACVTNAVSSQGVDSGPSETTTNACVTNDVSSQGLDTGLAKTTTNTRVSNAVSSQVMDSEPSETTRNACTTHNGNLENACVPLMDDARMGGLQ